MKVVYNSCYGGFSLSHDGIMRYAELKGIKIYPFVDARLEGENRLPYDTPDRYRPATHAEAKDAFIVHYCTTPAYSNESYWSSYSIGEDRSDPILVQVVEELGKKANGQCASLKIEDVPAGTLYRIDEYDGNEHVATQDSYEWNIAR